MKRKYKILVWQDGVIDCSCTNICRCCDMTVVGADYNPADWPDWREIDFREAVELTSSLTISDVYRAVKDFVAGRIDHLGSVTVNTKYCDYQNNHLAVANAGLRYKQGYA